ncbi:MAG TPA: O-antigen ligase family protein [Candidatus Limnocylindria bacterium]|nr:O-antigen ligase family protein [Candidatus Limnocylindria bacterium]
MILAERFPRARGWSVRGSVAWLRERPWIAVQVVILTWALIPEVRRLIDWKVGFNSISVVSVLPLLVLVPFALPFIYGKRLTKLPFPMLVLGWIWFGGFTFSLAVSVTTGNTFAALYSFAQFCLPAIFGFWVSSLSISVRDLFERVAIFMLWLATPLALYGALQFASPPPWDVTWMLYAKITSIGVPLPFQLRPFSTLNSPGIFADFLVMTIMFNLPRLRTMKPLAMGQLAFCMAVLILTMVRSDWIALVIGVVAYIIMSPQRAKNLTIMAGVVGVIAVLVMNVSALLGSSSAGSDLSTRIDTFSNLDNDVSYNERSRYWGEPLMEALESPLGQGLGVLGTAAKLGNSGTTHDFDNGYVARFTEMGYFGTLCYAAALLGALWLVLKRHRRFSRAGKIEFAAIGASVAAVQFSLLMLDVSSDHHNELSGLFFWLSLAMILGRDASQQANLLESAA